MIRFLLITRIPKRMDDKFELHDASNFSAYLEERLKMMYGESASVKSRIVVESNKEGIVRLSQEVTINGVFVGFYNIIEGELEERENHKITHQERGLGNIIKNHFYYGMIPGFEEADEEVVVESPIVARPLSELAFFSSEMSYEYLHMNLILEHSNFSESTPHYKEIEPTQKDNETLRRTTIIHPARRFDKLLQIPFP